MYVYYNPNPLGKQVGDCVVRALTMILHMGWDDVYDEICREGKRMADMPSSNSVWAGYLRKKGFVNFPLANTCPFCYTVRAFCEDHTHGEYLLSIGNHVVAIADGNYYDSWDSGNEVPISFWTKD